MKSPFRRGPKAPSTPRPKGSPGKRLYAVGDIHGCRREFDDLLEVIRADNAARPEKDVALVLLGDLIDRGPDSRGVMERFLEIERSDWKAYSLQGNHEEMMLLGLTEDAELLPQWLRHGGYACAESYGVPPDSLMGLDPASIQGKLQKAVPRAHLDLLRRMPDQIRFGDYLLVHAGIDPTRHLDDQDARALKWIREPFLESKAIHGVVVVHGHTVVETPEDLPNRIGIDTGAYRTGVLTALRLEDEERSFLASGGDVRSA